MRVFLDDLRETPEGWERTYTVGETIAALSTRTVTHLSLDNDLGELEPEGYKVLDWLEEEVFFDRTFPIPEIAVHSANASRVDYMKIAISSINRIRVAQLGESIA